MSKSSEMVQIALPKELLAQLLQNDALKAKDLKCLDEDSKQIVRVLCLQSCKPKQCSACSLHNYCGKTIYRQIQDHPVELVNKTH